MKTNTNLSANNFNLPKAGLNCIGALPILSCQRNAKTRNDARFKAIRRNNDSHSIDAVGEILRDMML